MARKKKTSSTVSIDLSRVEAFNIKNVFYASNIGGDFDGYSMIIFKDGGKIKDVLFDLLVAYSKEHNED